MVYRKGYNSPLGKIWMQSDGENLTGLWFDNSRDMAKHKTTFEAENLAIFDETAKWLDVYFAGKVPDFTPKYKIENATPFRNRVIEIISTIPYGETITYNDIAKQIAKEKGISKMSAQAVGGAVGWNPICIIIPCHRVVGASGNLVGYGGGMDNKVALLKIEKHDMKKFYIKNIAH